MHAPVSSTLTTADPERAHELVAAAYAENRLRVSGDVERFRFAHRRDDLGELRFDSFHSAPTTEYTVEPLGRLTVVRVVDQRMDVASGGEESRCGTGDVLLVAHPDQPYRTRVHGARLEITSVDLTLLPALVEDGSDPLAARLRRLSTTPLPPERARTWQHAVEYVRTSLVKDAPQSGPLVRAAGARMLAATLLTTFDTASEAASAPDRADATAATVRRAVAYLEAAPDLDIGVADIARVCHVSVRAVQLAFRRHLDTTPMAYLRTVRLDSVRRDLLDADPAAGETVTAIAARWGFLSGSRLATQYRAAYGESPRTTLYGG